MKTLNHSAKLVILLLFTGSCHTDPADIPTSQPSTVGNVVFWTADSSLIPLAITIEGAHNTTTVAQPSAPLCNASAFAIFTLLPRQTIYKYTASHGTSVWSGQIVVDGTISCVKQEIKK
jgi:hypothetical protein